MVIGDQCSISRENPKALLLQEVLRKHSPEELFIRSNGNTDRANNKPHNKKREKFLTIAGWRLLIPNKIKEKKNSKWQYR